jgi:taurine dioxygenase
MTQTIQIKPLAGAVGAEIHGIDLSAPLSDPAFQTIRQTVAESGVAVFRGQHLTPEQHIGVARRFSGIVVNRFFAHLEGYPEIALVVKEPHQTKNIGGGWHTDHSYDTIPAMGSMLYALEVPPAGGDTLFASMYAAYEALSDRLKHTLSGLRAVHSSRHVFGLTRPEMAGRIGNPDLATQDAVHPVVITHPESGKRALYVNPGFTLRFEGWTDEESQSLLGFLYQHAQRPEFSCRLRWQAGTLAFWDNRATWHRALNDYPGERRVMHRVTLDGVGLG